MSRLKLSRLFCLLCALSVFFGSFGLSALATSDSENLIDSDLRNWSTVNDVSIRLGNSSENSYVLSFSGSQVSNTYKYLFSGIAYGLTELSLEHNYSLKFNLSALFYNSEEEVNAFLENGSIMIGIASSYSDGIQIIDDESLYLIIDINNWKNYLEKDIEFLFTLNQSIVNPCLVVTFNSVVEFLPDDFTYRQFKVVAKNFSLTDTTEAEKQADEDNFFDRLFQFFHDLKWEIVGGDCEDSECPKNPHKSLPEKLGDVVKSLFVPDEEFIKNWKVELEELLSERLGIIYDAGDFFISLIQTIGDLLTTTADDIHYELPAMEVELNGETYLLWKAQEVDFSFLKENAFFAGLYKLYKAIVNVFLGIPLLNYAKKEMDATLHN